MMERHFARNNGSLEKIFAFVREVFGARGLEAEHAYDVDLILEELFTNMIKYANGPGREIAIGIDWTSPVLTLRLRDFDVEPFDITLVPPADTNAPLAARRKGGLGLHLVRRMSDRLDYEYDDRTSTTTITVTKRLGT
jgi:serine/threonine-protein kinase RsbW